jgi:endonuclease VIII
MSPPRYGSGRSIPLTNMIGHLSCKSMPDGDSIHRSASVLRTALIGKSMRCFDANVLEGPVPRAGRVIEQVERHGRHLELEWDDGLVLDTQMRLNGVWHVYRPSDRWRRPHTQMSAAIQVDDWTAVCFGALHIETYRRADHRRHPGMGRVGPDLCRTDIDLGAVVNLLLAHPDPDARLAEVLLDQRVMCGVGNVVRCEVLWATGLSPFAPIGRISEHDAIRLANTAATMLRSSLRVGRSDPASSTRSPMAVYGRTGQRCSRCADPIESRPMGRPQRMLYWCAGCQTHLDPKLERARDLTPMDPHPAAQRWISDLPWNRDAG